MGIDEKFILKKKITLKDLDELGHDNVSNYFVEKASKMAEGNHNLLYPLLYAAKGVQAVKAVAKVKGYDPAKLEDWRRGCSWLTFAHGALADELKSKIADFNELSTGLQKEAMKVLTRRGVNRSDQKILGVMRENDTFKELERQVSELGGIVDHVQGHRDLYNKALKDIIIQESANTRQIMKDSAQEERGMSSW